jgi:hypothetical protein
MLKVVVMKIAERRIARIRGTENVAADLEIAVCDWTPRYI